MGQKVSVFSIWRDSAKDIDQTLKQLEDLESLKRFDFSYYFYENDSKDNTVEILNKWLSSRSGELKSESLNAQKFGSTEDPKRMKFLVSCRNKCKGLAKENNSDYSLIFDSDIKFNKENFKLQLQRLNSLESAVMVTANCRQNIPDLTFGFDSCSYYDVHAFRDRYGSKGVYFSDCPSYQRDDQFDWKIGKPIITMSSFGGFAILRSEVFNKVKWSADVHCDHVNMCFDVSRYGNIYIEPKSKVFVYIDPKIFKLKGFQDLGSKQKKEYDNYYR